MTISGECLCGRVRYEIAGELFNAGHCHCSMCRRQHGAAFATYAECRPEDFAWISGEDSVRVYETRPGDGWCFCADCGSSLAGTDKGRVRYVTLGTVVGDPGVKPAAHEFVGSKAGWHEITDQLPQYDAWMPTSEK